MTTPTNHVEQEQCCIECGAVGYPDAGTGMCPECTHEARYNDRDALLAQGRKLRAKVHAQFKPLMTIPSWVWQVRLR